jgi:hypothetical protein
MNSTFSVFHYDIQNCGWVLSSLFDTENEALDAAADNEQVEEHNIFGVRVVQHGAVITLEE